MIYNIRGTSGSGKSTLVKRIMELYPNKDAIHIEGRKRPLGYNLYHAERALYVPGHYEVDCGGTDTISGYDFIFTLIREAHAEGYNVLYEGLLLSGDVKWTGALHTDGLPLTIIALDLPVEECVASVNARRWAKNPDKPGVKPDNTIAKHKGVQLAMKRLEAMGARVFWFDRDGAFDFLKKELDLG